MNRSLKNKIFIRKTLLNILIKYLSPTNSLVVYISQDLDKLILLAQKRLYYKYMKRIRAREKMILNYRKSLYFRNIA